MRENGAAQANSVARVSGSVPWIVTDVRPLPGYRLCVRFVEGTEGVVDLRRFITRERAGVFARLRDPQQFSQVYVDDGVVAWPGSLDLAPDAMYDAIRATGSWTPGD